MRALRAFFRKHPLVQLLALNMLTGFGLSAMVVGAMTMFDAGGFRTMTLGHGQWPVIVLLWFFVGLTFASVQMGMAVMSLIDEGTPGGGKRVRVTDAKPVRVTVTANGR
ncbi:MAG: hypothetical protein JNJ63_12585 [Hyphomonadaceae bacterium]|nr:hypothetical protein [Hyphomonadaceae bacterium]